MSVANFAQIIVVTILASREGVTRAATEAGGEGIEIFVGAVDEELGGSGGGMIVPGYVVDPGGLWGWLVANGRACSVGDIGDRLFLTIGK